MLAFLGGLLSILSPCILPVIPLVFSRSGRVFWREIAPMPGGLARAGATLGGGPASAMPSSDAGLSLDAFVVEEKRRATLRSFGAPEGSSPSLDGGTERLNSPPLTPDALRGRVVLVDFWTLACYNCQNALPHVKELYGRYRDRGFVVGVRTPELTHERVLCSVRSEVKKLGITYPVVIDNDFKIWRAFHNQYWPPAYYADANGTLRFHHFGEGRYEERDRVVAALLAERDAALPRRSR